MVSIAKSIKCIEFSEVEEEWNEIVLSIENGSMERNGRSKLGNKIIDYYFFEERLQTKGKNGICFYEFVNDIETYGEKRYIQTLMNFTKEKNRYADNEHAKLYYIYGLAFGRISPFKITNAIELYQMFSPTSVFDPCMGWGGRLLGAIALDINYIGCDLNINLRKHYKQLQKDFREKHSSTVKLYFQDALSLDYNDFKYDMVFTSPPYFNIEQYNHMPLKSRQEWAEFYHDLFSLTYKHLSHGGAYAINCSIEIYNLSLYPLLGEPYTKIELSKSTRNSTYKEWIYVWIKE